MDGLSDYIAALRWVAETTGQTQDSLHVHAGLALYLLTQIVLRTRRASWRALQVVITAALLHEAVERVYYGSWRWEDTRMDIMMTILWPTLLYAMGRYRRHRWDMREGVARDAANLLRRPFSA